MRDLRVATEDSQRIKRRDREIKRTSAPYFIFLFYLFMGMHLMAKMTFVTVSSQIMN